MNMTIDKRWNPDPEGMRDTFVDWYNKYVFDPDVKPMKKDETYVVWYCYIVGNAKALISTTRDDHMYYELTWHKEASQLHIDQYLKVKHTDINRSE